MNYLNCEMLQRPSFELPNELNFIINQLDKAFDELGFMYAATVERGISIDSGWPLNFILHLLAIIDAAAQMLMVKEISNNKAIFTNFFCSYYPENQLPLEFPEEPYLTKENLFNDLYSLLRNPLVHRIGFYKLRESFPAPIIAGKLYPVSKFTALANASEPFEAQRAIYFWKNPTVDRHIAGKKPVLWLQVDFNNFYWCARRSIENAISDEKRSHLFEKWILSGGWDYQATKHLTLIDKHNLEQLR